MSEDIPFVDIAVDEQMVDRAIGVLESGRFVKGPECESFESEFATACDSDYAVGVSNGTAALFLSLKALDISRGDQVFVPAHTFFASVSPVLELGAEPKIVDIDPERYTMDPDKLQASVDDSTNPACIIVTHMHGQPAEMDPILDLASEYQLPVVEDAAQAHLAQYKQKRVGSIGDIGCFSFYPTKNMTVAGDGGMLVTDDEKIAEITRALRNHGRTDSNQHTRLGLNNRLDEFKAAVGSEQLHRLPEWTYNRRRAATKYDRHLSAVDGIIRPKTFDDSMHVYHHYPIQAPKGERKPFRIHLEENGIGTGIHYEVAVHEHPAIRERVDDVTAPNAENLCNRIISLPMHPRLAESEIESVCSIIGEYFK